MIIDVVRFSASSQKEKDGSFTFTLSVENISNREHVELVSIWLRKIVQENLDKLGHVHYINEKSQ